MRKAVPESRKEYTRSQGDPKTAGDVVCVYFWRQMFSLVNGQCLLSDEAKSVSAVKSLKNSPSSTILFIFLSSATSYLLSFL